jgi:hypothetical protein
VSNLLIGEMKSLLRRAREVRLIEHQQTRLPPAHVIKWEDKKGRLLGWRTASSMHVHSYSLTDMEDVISQKRAYNEPTNRPEETT